MNAYYVTVEDDTALARMTEGKAFSEAVHAMAELLERVFAENWAPPQRPAPFIEPDRAARLAPGIEQARAALRANAERKSFHIVEQDGITVREVGEAEMLQLARDQYPAGLVPVGVDLGDDDQERDATSSDLTSDEDFDLSSLA